METMWPSLLLLQSVVMEREGELLERVGRLFGISSPNPALISASILHKELMESSGWGKQKANHPTDRRAMGIPLCSVVSGDNNTRAHHHVICLLLASSA